MVIDFTALNNACVLYYSMDNADISGSTILDLTPNNNDGTINGATTGVSGILNEAISFDGVNDEIDVGTGTQFQPSKIFISVWSEMPDYNNWQNFLAKRGSAREYQFYVYKSSGELTFDVGTTTYKGDVVTTGQRNHYVIAHNGTDLKFFINGVLTNTFTNVVPLSYSSNEPFKIGTDNVGNFYKGSMDEVAFLGDDWTTAGTAQEIATYLYNSGAPTVNQQYPFSSNVVYEIKGQVTLSGTATQGATLRLYDQTGGTYDGSTTTDVSGNYLFENLTDTNEYHVSVEYDDGTTKYNDESKPYVTPTEQ